MPRQAQAQHPVAGLAQGLAQGAQAVGAIGHAMQQQHPRPRLRWDDLVAVVPVRGPGAGIAGAPGAVAHQGLLRAARGLGVDPRVQFGEEPRLQGLIIGQGADLVGLVGGEFRLQFDLMPGLQGRTVQGPEDVEDMDTRQEAQHGDAQIEAQAFGVTSN